MNAVANPVSAVPVGAAAPLLSLRDVSVGFVRRRGTLMALENIDLAIAKGEILGIVGESGSGKSLTALSIMGLLAEPGRVVGGEIRLDGVDLTKLPKSAMRKIRGSLIAMIFQNPRSSLNPVMRVAEVLQEVLRVHGVSSRQEAREQAAALLRQVGLADAQSILSRYPHQLSGGMAQRVMIALALASSPELLIADEPTTALDVTIQHQIITLLLSLRETRQLAQIVITHNFGVVAELCDRVAVMYAGRIVEEGPVVEIFDNARHPYTKALLASRLKGGDTAPVNIPGQVPALTNRPSGCYFRDRCPGATEICATATPPFEAVSEGHRVACYNWRSLS